jgi:hypothetical protein
VVGDASDSASNLEREEERSVRNASLELDPSRLILDDEEAGRGRLTTPMPPLKIPWARRIAIASGRDLAVPKRMTAMGDRGEYSPSALALLGDRTQQARGALTESVSKQGNKKDSSSAMFVGDCGPEERGEELGEEESRDEVAGPDCRWRREGRSMTSAADKRWDGERKERRLTSHAMFLDAKWLDHGENEGSRDVRREPLSHHGDSEHDHGKTNSDRIAYGQLQRILHHQVLS